MENKKRKILVLVAQFGYSFINQAKGLAKGLDILNIDNKIIRVTDKYPKQEIVDYNPSVVVGIGSWNSYEQLVKYPADLGFKVLPWLVSDKKVEKFVEELNQLKFFLTTSKHCKEVFVGAGVKAEKIGILYEAVDPDYWKEIPKEELKYFIKLISIQEDDIEIPSNYDLFEIKNKKIPILFTTGGDVTNKGAQEILKALNLIDKKIPWIYMIKTWPSPNSFRKSVEEFEIVIQNNMWQKIRYFSGEFSQDFIRNLMNVCDIYIACSRDEGFGLPLVEAQLCGKPIITMEATSTQEVVKSGVTALVSKSIMTENGPRADINDLSVKLQEMLTNWSKINGMGLKARPWAMGKFSPKIIASQLLDYLLQSYEY